MTHLFPRRSNHVEENTVQNGDCDILGLNWTEAQRFEDEGLGSLTGERRRRRLPEIPANKKRKSLDFFSVVDLT